MKKSFLRLASLLSAVAMLVIVFGVSSCKKDSTTNTTPPVIILDGYYVKGGATVNGDNFNSNAMMKVTRNEVTQTDRPSLLELYIPLKAGAEGFNIVQVAGSTKKTYGPGSDYKLITQGTTDEPKYPFYRGSYTESATKFTVDTNGLYHVVIDTELGKVVVAPVHWGIIGAATPNGWGSSTQFTESVFNGTTMNWTITGMQLKKGDWKLRYSQGWKIELDTNLDLGGGKKGVKVNTNFGNRPDSLVPGGNNIVDTVPGIYNVDMSYTLGSGYTLTLTRTGNIPPIDYSTYQMGIIGNAYLIAPGDTANWDQNFGTSLPQVSGTNYTWTYTLDLFADRQFKFRQGEDWNGKSIGFTDVTMAGPDAANFEDSGSDHNFKVKVGGNYTIVLLIDATNEKYTVTATKNSK